MKTVGIRALRENPGVLSQCAAAGEYLLVTNRNEPVSLSVPFDDTLLNQGVHVNMAVKFYEDGVLTLARAAQVAGMPVEAFLKTLASLGVVVVDQSNEELLEDLETIE